MVKAEVNGEFPGGQVVTYNVANNGVGIPEVNPNLSEDVIKTVKEVEEKIKSGELVIKSEQGNLIR